MSKITVNLVGAGRVGQTILGLLRSLPDYTIQDVLSARLASARNAIRFAGAGRAVENYTELNPADMWILAVPDSQIAPVSARIAEGFGGRESPENRPVAFHCSGFFASDQMSPLRRLGWQLASVHPVLTISDPEIAIQQFEGVYCGIEGDASALEPVRHLLKAVGAHPFQIKTEDKSLYHAAAVFSNNFTVVLQAIAREAWAAAGVPDDIAKELNAKLLQATAENVIAQGPGNALTGPASRGDQFVVAQQGNDVRRWNPSVGNLYKDMSALAMMIAAQGTVGGTTDNRD